VRSSRILPTALIFLAAILLGFYFLSPFMLLRSLSYAVKNRDRNAIAEDVDFFAVRESLKQQLDSYLKIRQKGPHKLNRFSNLLLSLAPSIGGQVIDSIVTPDGVTYIISQHVSQNSAGPSRPSLWQGKFSWRGPNHFQASYVNQRHPDQPFALDLERKGLFEWQITGLTLPIKELGRRS
jgi:hypothetical protein